MSFRVIPDVQVYTCAPCIMCTPCCSIRSSVGSSCVHVNSKVWIISGTWLSRWLLRLQTVVWWCLVRHFRTTNHNSRLGPGFLEMVSFDSAGALVRVAQDVSECESAQQECAEQCEQAGPQVRTLWFGHDFRRRLHLVGFWESVLVLLFASLRIASEKTVIASANTVGVRSRLHIEPSEVVWRLTKLLIR